LHTGQEPAGTQWSNAALFWLASPTKRGRFGSFHDEGPSGEIRGVVGLKQGPPYSFETLYQKYGTDIYRFCHRLCGNATEAEDLTQEVFLSALRGLDRFEGRSTVLHWLRQIAFHAWTRSKRNSLETVPLDEHTGNSAVAPDPSDGWVDLLVVGRAMEKLPDPLWQALVLVKAEGLKYREAAQLLGVPQGTVQYRVHQAMERLRELLKDEEASASGGLRAITEPTP